MFDTDTLSYSADKLYSDLFDGFFFFAAVLGMVIAIFIVCAKYKANPTVGKRRAIRVLSILITVFDSLLLIAKIDLFSFLYNPYNYFKSGRFTGNDFSDPVAQAVCTVAYIVIIVTVIVGIIACVIGYRTVANKALTAAAYKTKELLPEYKDANKVCAVCGHSVPRDAAECPRCAGTVFALIKPVEQYNPQNAPGVQTPVNPDACPVCGGINEHDAAFCSQCGTALRH